MAPPEQAGRSAAPGEQRAPAAQHHRRKIVDDLTDRNVRMIVEIEKAAKSSIGAGPRLAARVAAFFGSMTFVWIHVALFATWIFVNTSSAFENHPDPFPFSALTFGVTLEAIFLSAFILISQNHEARLTEQRSHLDLQINLLAERENTQMLRMLQSIATKIGADYDEDPELDALQESTRPEVLLEQIDKATQQTGKPQSI